jgi:RecA/RadA recombinase
MVLIELFGSPSCGKSTLAAEIFAKLKRIGKEAEVVQEAAKERAWANLPIDAVSQVHVLSEQVKRETRLYKVGLDFVVTDSPILLGAFYDFHFSKGHLPLVQTFMSRIQERRAKRGVRIVPFMLPRRDTFSDKGRYQTREQAWALHGKIEEYVKTFVPGIPTLPLDEQAEAVLDTLKKKGLL